MSEINKFLEADGAIIPFKYIEKMYYIINSNEKCTIIPKIKSHLHHYTYMKYENISCSVVEDFKRYLNSQK